MTQPLYALQDPLRELTLQHAPTAAALRSYATVAVLQTEIENPQAPGPAKQALAEDKLIEAMAALYAAFEAQLGDQPPWVDLLVMDGILPHVPAAIRWAVAQFNRLGLFQGKPRPPETPATEGS